MGLGAWSARSRQAGPPNKQSVPYSYVSFSILPFLSVEQARVQGLLIDQFRAASLITVLKYHRKCMIAPCVPNLPLGLQTMSDAEILAHEVISRAISRFI